MPLPVIEYPIVEIYLHSLNRKVNFRPFLVKEEKILLIAKESKEANEVKTAIKQIIQNCILEELDVSTLPLFDIEMIFVKLRAKSVGESVKLVYTCRNPFPTKDGVPCDTDTNYSLNLDKIKYELPEGHNNTIQITDTLGIKLKYANLGINLDFSKEEDEDEEYVTVMKLLASNIDYIYDGESLYRPEDVPAEELVTFLENLTIEKMHEIQNFYNSSPKVVLEDQVICSKCGFEHKIHNEDLVGFFI